MNESSLYKIIVTKEDGYFICSGDRTSVCPEDAVTQLLAKQDAESKFNRETHFTISVGITNRGEFTECVTYHGTFDDISQRLLKLRTEQGID